MKLKSRKTAEGRRLKHAHHLLCGWYVTKPSLSSEVISLNALLSSSRCWSAGSELNRASHLDTRFIPGQIRNSRLTSETRLGKALLNSDFHLSSRSFRRIRPAASMQTASSRDLDPEAYSKEAQSQRSADLDCLLPRAPLVFTAGSGPVTHRVLCYGDSLTAGWRYCFADDRSLTGDRTGVGFGP